MSDEIATLLAGFGDRFTLRDEYVGGEGRTLRVSDRDGRDLVLKVLAAGFEPEEAAVLSGLQHPAIPAVLEVGRIADGRAYVLRDHVEGSALTELPFDLRELREVVREILEVLAFVHLRGVVHLDLKPQNLLRAASGRLVLLDFGLAARSGDRGRGGTPFFAAPELLVGAAADARADQFSLGAMVAQAMWPGGRLPLDRFLRRFPADDFWIAAGVTPDDFPSELAPFLERCLSRRPNRRFHDAQAAMEFLCGGSGRPSPGLLTPDPVAVWQPEVSAVTAAVVGDVIVRGAAADDRRAVAMHLVATEPAFTALAEHAEHIIIPRQGDRQQLVELTPLGAARLRPHLAATFGLDGRAVEAAAEWIVAQACDGTAAIGVLLLSLVENGEIVAGGSRWVWPAASSGRLGRSEAAAHAPTAANVHALAARGRREASIALYRRGVAANGAAEPALRHALADGMLDGGEPAKALPLCADAPILRAQALLDMGQAAAAGRELAAAGDDEHPRRRRLTAQLLLTRGDAGRAADLLDPPQSTDEALTLVAMLDSAGRAAQRDRLIKSLVARLSADDQPYALASTLTVAGHAARREGDLDAAAAHFERAAELLFGLGQVRHIAGARLNLGLIAKDRGSTDAAIELLREARTLYQHVGDAAGTAIAASNLGTTSLAGGDAAAARPWLERGAAELDALGNRDAGRLARAMLAQAYARLGDRRAAAVALEAVGDPGTGRLATEVALARKLLDRGAHPSPAESPHSEPHSSMPPIPGPSRELFRTFLAVNRQLAQETDLDKAMRHLLDAAVTLTGGRQGYLLVKRDNGVQREFESGDPGVSGQAFSRSLAHRAIDLQRTLTGVDVLADRELQEMPSIRNLEVRSAVCAPFRSAGGTSGAIYVEHAGRADAFDESDKEALEVLADQAAIAVDRMLRDEALTEELVQSKRALAVAKRGRRKPTNLLGDSPVMKALRAEIDKLAPLDLPVLVLGDTGTGKELVARALHERSGRRKQPFVAENCSALPAELLERELFGHVQGAFTGADSDRPGLLELASGGTLFLDEVGDMPVAMQAKLLRALQEQAIRRVGSQATIRLDFRLVAATHKDLRAMIEKGEFREDLFFRLAAVELRVPALRDRGDDIQQLALHFLERHARENGRTLRFAGHVTAALAGYGWPGNVRELEHVIARAALLTDSDEIVDLQLPAHTPAASPNGASVAAGAAEVLPLKEVERAAIVAAMQHFGGDKTKTARALGISRTALYEKLKRYETS